MPLLSELLYRLFWHNFSVLEVTYYAQNNASIMWKSLVLELVATKVVIPRWTPYSYFSMC